MQFGYTYYFTEITLTVPVYLVPVDKCEDHHRNRIQCFENLEKWFEIKFFYWIISNENQLLTSRHVTKFNWLNPPTERSLGVWVFQMKKWYKRCSFTFKLYHCKLMAASLIRSFWWSKANPICSFKHWIFSIKCTHGDIDEQAQNAETDDLKKEYLNQKNGRQVEHLKTRLSIIVIDICSFG